MTSESEIFRGSLVAIVTPFKNGGVDYEAFESLVAWHVTAGTNAIVVSGTTGESPTLTESERVELFSVAKRVAGDVPVVAGTGSNNTAHVIEASKAAEEAGADALLLVTPYYNKPTQGGLIAHYRAVADRVGIPICLYSVPGRTAVAISADTAAALSEHPRIAALKEAGGSVDKVSEVRQKCDIIVLSGDDPLTIPMMAVGAKGVVSVTANVAPAEVAEMAEAAAAGDWRRALALHDRIWPLSKALFVETNPVPVKAALEMMGKVGPELRLPLVPISAGARETLAAAMRDFGLKVAG